MSNDLQVAADGPLATLGGCAVLWAMPIDWNGYAACARGDGLDDYMRLTLAGDDPARVWADRYERVADAGAALAATAARLGARLATRATLAALHEASKTCRAIILMAHWRGPNVVEADLLAPQEAIRQRLNEAALTGLTPIPPGLTRRALAALLDRAVRERALVPHGAALADDVHRSALLGACVSRDLLDEALREMIAPGNMIELYDGLHRPGTLVDAVQDAFEGEIDLATCTSLPLATMLKHRFRERVWVLHTTALIDPLPLYILTRLALEDWAKHGGVYRDARLRIAEALRQAGLNTQ